MFGKKRETTQLPENAGYDLGVTIGRCLFKAVAGYLDYRLSQLTVKTLTLLAERFETIHDELNHLPEVAAKVEFDIFRNNLNDFQPRLKAEIETFLSDWLLIAAIRTRNPKLTNTSAIGCPKAIKNCSLKDRRCYLR